MSSQDTKERDNCLFFHFDPEEVPVLQDAEGLADVLRQSLEEAGIETFTGAFHKFPTGGEGVTAVRIIGASCADIHTWPENQAMILRCFACGDKDQQVKAFIASMQTRLHPARVYNIESRDIVTSLPTVIPADWTLIHERSLAHHH